MLPTAELCIYKKINNCQSAVKPGPLAINRCQPESLLAILVYIMTFIAAKTTNMAAAAMT